MLNETAGWLGKRSSLISIELFSIFATCTLSVKQQHEQKKKKNAKKNTKEQFRLQTPTYSILGKRKRYFCLRCFLVFLTKKTTKKKQKNRLYPAVRQSVRLPYYIMLYTGGYKMCPCEFYSFRLLTLSPYCIQNNQNSIDFWPFWVQ